MSTLVLLTFFAFALATVIATRKPITSALLLVVALAFALAVHVATPLMLVWLAVLVGATLLYVAQSTTMKIVGAIAFIVVSLALGMHKLPGFNNPLLVENVRITADAVPYTLYWNLDKPLAGLVFLIVVYWSSRTPVALGQALRTAAPLMVVNIAVVLIASLLLGYLRWEPKWLHLFWSWAFSNLFLTCVAEEAFFRAFIQTELENRLVRVYGGKWLAIGIAGCLFGIAHFAGGWQYVVLASIAGCGYGYVYYRTRSIEASILAHFSLNTIHFLLFTYPALAAID